MTLKVHLLKIFFSLLILSIVRVLKVCCLCLVGVYENIVEQYQFCCVLAYSDNKGIELNELNTSIVSKSNSGATEQRRLSFGTGLSDYKFYILRGNSAAVHVAGEESQL